MLRLFDPYRQMLKKMGFPADQEGYIHRYLSEKSNWESHLENSRRFIIESIGDRKGDKIAVLGSGWQLYLPMEFLLERFNKVLLYDVIHPAQIYHKQARNKKIEFHFSDITGNALQETWEMYRRKRPRRIEQIPSRQFTPGKDVDFVISHNLLSQLDAFPADFTEDYMTIAGDLILQFRKRIQQNHLNMVSRYPSCLITDVSETYHDKNEEIIEKQNVFIEFPPTKNSVEWEWIFDTRGDYHKGSVTKLLVRAVCFEPV